MRHRVGIRDLRDQLSRWLERVKKGDEVVVTDHGRPVVRLVSYAEPARARTEKEHLAHLVAAGIVVPGNGKGWRPWKPLVIPGVDLSGAVLEDREEDL